jgi:hypothetical protein
VAEEEEKSPEEKGFEISPETVKELKEEEKRPETLLELIKSFQKAQDRKKQTLYDEILPGK